MAFLFSCFLILSIVQSNSHTIRDTNKLLKDKQADYNKSTRPTYNQSSPTTVHFGLEIIYIQEFDQLQQKLSFIALPTLSWIDEEMKWNPADYGGMVTLVAPSGLFWIPNLALGNSIEKTKPIGDDWQKVRYGVDGTAFYSPGTIYSCVCGADITYYPYDIHTCLLYFYPEGYNPSEVQITVTNEKIGKNYYIENGGWDFVDSRIKVTNSELFVELTVSITLQRKPRYVIINIILPIIFLAYLSNIVFVIPADSGERISYSITILLAIAVYLTIVGDNLPKTSFPMSYFSYYLLTMLVTSMLITMATIFNLRVIHNDDSGPITGIWAKLATCFKCRKQNRGKKYSQKIKTDNKHEKENGCEIGDNIHHMGIGDMYERNSLARRLQVSSGKVQHLDIIVKPQMILSNDETDTVESLSWKDVSVALDKIFFVIFFIILTVATVVYVVVIAREHSK